MNTPNWSNLTFSYSKTNTILRSVYKDGAWSQIESLTDDNLKISAFAGCLHYAIECFEGLKAFRGKDGKVRIFRPYAHAARMASGARKLCLPMVSVDDFVEACKEVVRRNLQFLPPYESRAALYIRPVLFGTRPRLTV